MLCDARCFYCDGSLISFDAGKVAGNTTLPDEYLVLHVDHPQPQAKGGPDHLLNPSVAGAVVEEVAHWLHVHATTLDRGSWRRSQARLVGSMHSTVRVQVKVVLSTLRASHSKNGV